MKITIASKLTALSGVLLLTPVIVAVCTFVQSGKLEEQLVEITEVSEPASKVSQELEIHALAAGHAVLEYIHDLDEKHLAEIEAEQSEFERLHKVYESIVQSDESKRLGVDVKEAFDRYREATDELLLLANSEETTLSAFEVCLERLRTLVSGRPTADDAPSASVDARKHELALTFDLSAARIAANLAASLKFHDAVHREKVGRDQVEWNRALATFQSLSLNPTEEQWIAEVKAVYEETVGLATAVLAADETMSTTLAQLDQQRKRLHEVISGQIQRTVHTDLSEAKNSAHARLDALNAAVVGLAGAAILIGLFVAWAISKTILVSVNSLREGVGRLTQGDLKHRIERKTQDELGDLSEAFNHMAQCLDDQQLATSKGIVQLQSVSMEILASTSQQASGMEEQNAAVTETVATMKELGHAAEKAAERAGIVKDVMERTGEVGEAGRGAVEKSIAAMDKVRQQVNSIAEDNLGLAERAQAIGDIIATVNDVTDQTNLLALNAAVEAARAGEYGKGFGVVAAEIKALAEQSREATRQVSQILRDIQKATNAAVLATEQGTRDADEATHVVKEAGATISQLSSSLEETSMIAAQIAASAGQQAIGVKQVNEAMGHLEMVAREQVAATRQVEAAMGDLQNLGRELGELAGQGPSPVDPPRPGAPGQALLSSRPAQSSAQAADNDVVLAP